VKRRKRVVSLVPSWTETLLACGVEVVGRTRYCVHPESAGLIPVVGGTKDLNIELLKDLRPDVLILDKEENLPWMADAHSWRTVCSHVASVTDMPSELHKLSDLLDNSALEELSMEWSRELACSYLARNSAQLPGVLEWLRAPVLEPEHFVYLIWRDPWMAVGPSTFIGSLLTHLGFGKKLLNSDEKYPLVNLGELDPAKTLLLFATEPYPFALKKAELLSLEFPCAIIDGESYSWFGLRSLRFLQRSRGESS
jgi:ABC-type Fe3+-hydroxamate transport system substrate-binding protein